MIRPGPALCLIVSRVDNGIMLPAALRTFRRPMSSGCMRNGAAYRPDIGIRGAVEETVEQSEEPAEQPVDHAGEEIALCPTVMRRQQHAC